MDKTKIPNALTFARMAAVLVALLVIVKMPQFRALLFWIFLLAALTDFLDGYLARKWHTESALGALFDPVADKLLVALMLLYLLKLDQRWELILPVALIILRELYVGGLREFLGLRGKALPVSRGGKWKTAVQMVAIGGMLFGIAYGAQSAWMIGRLLLWVAALLAVLSAFDYTRKTLAELR
jgi:cardiolipin synthase